LQVAHNESLRRETDALRSAIRAAGLRSLYGDDRSMTVTVLERVDRHESLDQSRWGLPLELFTADELIVSRIVDASTYDILDRVARLAAIETPTRTSGTAYSYARPPSRSSD